MSARMLLALYPRAWRERYGEEMAELLRGRRASAGLVADLLRGAFDAHLHPGLVTPALVVAGGGTTIDLSSRTPRRGLVLAMTLVLALAGWGLAQPMPFIPLILPIGAHASPSAFARSQVDERLPLLATAERDGMAAVFFANTTNTELVIVRRTRTLGWTGGGGGRSSGPEVSADAPLARVGFSSGWSSAQAFGGEDSLGWVAVHGVTASSVRRVELVFADGTREVPPLRDGAFLWFDARTGQRSPAMGPAGGAAWLQEAFGRVPIANVAFASEGRELARQEIGRFR